MWALGEGRRALGGFGERDDVQALNIGVCVCGNVGPGGGRTRVLRARMR